MKTLPHVIVPKQPCGMKARDDACALKFLPFLALSAELKSAEVFHSPGILFFMFGLPLVWVDSPF